MVVFVVIALMMAHASQTGQLGTVSFPTSAAGEVQPIVERAVALLHSFQYQEASDAFEEAAQRDPSCAMCHWGKAMALYQQLWEWPNADVIEQGRREIAEGQRIGPPTPREHAYLAAAAAFFNPPPAVSHARRIRAYSRAMATVHRENPADGEATAFYALSLLALADANVDADANRRRAIDLLTRLFHQQPNHPGAAHYLIHAADRPDLARFGLEAAQAYAEIAPDSSHALHMPSHIFVRLGMWTETAQTNVRAAAAGKRAAAEGRGDYTYQVHALDYVQYAYLQLGKSASARALLDELRDVPTASENEKTSDRLMSAGRAALEEHRWGEAAALPLPAIDQSWLRDAYWARAIGAARGGDAVSARQNLDAYRATVRPGASIPIQQLEADAWVAFAEKRSRVAIRALRQAGERERREGGDETAIPAREMLADLLFELQRPSEALHEYRAVLLTAPRRFDALLGAARAANALRMKQESARYYKQLLEVAAPEADRPELDIARAYIESARVR
jgi:hypothetical protein